MYLFQSYINLWYRGNEIMETKEPFVRIIMQVNSLASTAFGDNYFDLNFSSMNILKTPIL